MSPTVLGDGSTVPDPVEYERLPTAQSRDLNGTTVGPARPAQAGEPAASANHLNDALEDVTDALNGVRAGLVKTAGVRVLNTTTGAWELWPIYASATDPDQSVNPPTGNYVWLQQPTEA